MSSARSKTAAAVASVGVLFVGWQIGTSGGRTATPPTSTGTGPVTAAARTTTAKQDGSSKTGTYTGATSSFRYGAITVTATLSAGKITDVTAKIQSDGARRSDSINSQAIPILKSRVIAANSANVQTVAGATYTSQAYLSSLQSALSKA